MSPHPTAIQTKSGTGAEALVAIITSRKDAFAQVAPKHFSVERLVKLAHASLSRTPGLAQCTPTSVLVQLMRCAELGLEPNSPLGGMHLVPFKNRRTNRMECQGIIDYRALVALARRSDQISAIAARAERLMEAADFDQRPAVEAEDAVAVPDDELGRKAVPVEDYQEQAAAPEGEGA